MDPAIDFDPSAIHRMVCGTEVIVSPYVPKADPDGNETYGMIVNGRIYVRPEWADEVASWIEAAANELGEDDSGELR